MEVNRASVVNFFLAFIGLIVGFFCHFFVNKWTKLDEGDVIAIISILVNIAFGLLIVFLVQKKLSDEREIKNFLIKEVNEINEDYRRLMNGMRRGKVAPKYVVEWFKAVGMRIIQLNHFLSSEFQIQYPNLNDSHQKLRQLITNDQEFNNNFTKAGFKPKVKKWNEILTEHQKIRHCFLDIIVKINHA